MEDTEKKLGTWTLPPKDKAVQLASDPICATADCPDVHLSADHDPIKYPINYSVPDFGTDSDMLHTAANEKAAAEQLGHTWTPEKDPVTDKWVVPTEDAEFKLLQTGAYSDPNFNSHDGYLLHHTKLERETHAGKVEYDLDPKLDADILSTHSHLADQEAKLGKLSSTNLQVASEVESLEREFSDIKKKVEASDKAAAINLA